MDLLSRLQHCNQANRRDLASRQEAMFTCGSFHRMANGTALLLKIDRPAASVRVLSFYSKPYTQPNALTPVDRCSPGRVPQALGAAAASVAAAEEGAVGCKPALRRCNQAAVAVPLPCL